MVYLWGVLWVLMSVLPWLWLNKWGQATPSLLFFVMVGPVINLVYIILNGWLRKDWLNQELSAHKLVEIMVGVGQQLEKAAGKNEAQCLAST
jgi:hypothetical protein